ncbi:MAG: serine--tRNA ligase [Firmicutes bacterium]|nr:serine--tRNA ligase [Bacillota bacterium]
MLDLQLIKDQTQKVVSLLAKKGFKVNFDGLLQDAQLRKQLLLEVEQVKAEVNKLSASVPEAKKAGKDVQSIFSQVKILNQSIQGKEQELKALETKIDQFLLELPNLPDEDLKEGGKENNEAIRIVGKQPIFNFKLKDHVEIAENLGIIDYQRAAKISGAGTWIYRGLGAQLEWALLNFFMSEHLKDGYEMVLLPHLLNYESGLTAGQFPKFKDDVFWLKKTEPEKFLLPTAETGLVNLHRDEILDGSLLPKKYFAYTPCYRYEAGSYRSEERGMIRGYQFNKVELVQYTREEQSPAMFLELVAKASSLVEKLGLHFRVSKLAAGDCSHSMARTHDIEVYIPSLNIYKEVSSVSNARDYQARRGKIRYKDPSSQKTKFAHTLNASALATSRIVPAILEQYQLANGDVKIPNVLVPFMGGLTVIGKQK